MGIEPVSMSSAQRVQEGRLLVEQVTKQFGQGEAAVEALKPIDLSVRDGDFVCIVGPSGCGKSTLLNILAGFDYPSSGYVHLDGKPIIGPGPERGVVFQQGALFEWLTVLDNVMFGPQALGKPASEARDIGRHYLSLVGLSSFANRYPYELSGGMQQRVAIARALANDPQILLMDEPFAALDHQTRELLQEEIRKIWRKTGKTILWITHSIDEALFLATHIVVMSARPGSIKMAYESHFSADNDILVTTTPEFAEAKRAIVALLREESLEAQRQEIES